MRHGKKINHLGRTASHRKAMLSNMASSLILEKRIFTTVAKAKALRKYVEPLITKSKDDSMNSRRTVFSYLQNKYSVTELFGPVAAKAIDRPGGYTRIIKTGNRLGDNAEMCMIELVDFNEMYGNDKKQSSTKSKRSRRGGAKKETATKEKVEKTEAVQPENKVEAIETEKSADESVENNENSASETDENKAEE